MRWSDTAIRNPVFTWMLMIGLIFFGAVSFNRLGISQMPDVDFPVVTVNLEMEGASPEIMESDVVDPIEDAVMGVEGVVNVTSESRHGTATVTVELELGRNVDTALQEINASISQARRRLPDELEAPVIRKTNPEDQPVLWLAVTSDKPLKEMMLFVRNRLRDRFVTVPGVAEIILGGYVDRAMRVWVKRDKLSNLDLTVDDLITTIAREHIEIPGGRLETISQEISLRAMGEATGAEQMKRLPIVVRGGAPVFRPIRIDEVASVEDGLDDIRRISRFNGKPAVGLGFRKQRGSNAVAVAQGVIARMHEVREILPEGFNIEVSFDSSVYIEEAIDELKFTLLLSAILTGVVCWFFLGSISSTVNVLLAIPTSIVGAFTILYFMGFTLNTFTMLALSLAIGIVVDDAIMMLENIVRHREKGETLEKAALKGAREIGFAVLATSLAIIAIFLPVAFMKGIIGEYFFQFGVAISTAVFLSLVEALTLTPMRASQFLTVRDESRSLVSRAFNRLAAIYRVLLERTLRHPMLVTTAALTFFACSLLLLFPLSKEFVPSQDQSRLLLRFRMPVGSSLEKTDSLVKMAEEAVMKRPEFLRYFTAVGGFGGNQANTAMMFLTLKPYRERGSENPFGRPMRQMEFANEIRKELNKISPEMKVVVQDLSTRNFAVSRGFPVEFNIRGPDWNTLGRVSEQVEAALQKSGALVDVDSSFLAGQPEMRIEPDREAANLRGVSMAAIGNTVGAMIGGRKIAQFTEEGRRYDIRLRVKEEFRQKAEDIRKLYVRNNRGELVPLSEVVKIVQQPTLQSITRESRERSVSIFANPAPGLAQQQALDKALEIARGLLPQGYYIALTGSSKATEEAFSSLLFSLVMGIAIAYMILGSQFNSFIHPITVLLAMPFSFTGAIILLYLTGQSLNIYSFIGLILLMGLVKKNSIMLVEFANQKREQGLSVRDALLEACPVRLRPIMMTSIATIAAAIPPALAIGPGSETTRPMALSVLGGMSLSTILTLFVVPAAYLLFSRYERGKRH